MEINVKVNINDIITSLFENAETDYESGHGAWVITPDIDIKEEIKKSIIYQTKHAVLDEIKQPLRDQMKGAVIDIINSTFSTIVETEVKKYISDNKFKPRGYSNEEFTITEFVATEFEDAVVNRNINDIVKKDAERAAKEIRNRYDLLFASSLVAKMNDQGLLKEGVFKAIMNDKK